MSNTNKADPVVRVSTTTKEHVAMLAAMNGVSQKKMVEAMTTVWRSYHMNLKVKDL